MNASSRRSFMLCHHTLYPAVVVNFDGFFLFISLQIKIPFTAHTQVDAAAAHHAPQTRRTKMQDHLALY